MLLARQRGQRRTAEKGTHKVAVVIAWVHLIVLTRLGADKGAGSWLRWLLSAVAWVYLVVLTRLAVRLSFFLWGVGCVCGPGVRRRACWSCWNQLGRIGVRWMSLLRHRRRRRLRMCVKMNL